MNRKHILIILSILLLLPWGGYGAKAKKAVFIIVDGVPADMIERLKPPAIGRIAAEGGYSRAYCGGIAGTYWRDADHFGCRVQLHPDLRMGQQAQRMGQFSEARLQLLVDFPDRQGAEAGRDDGSLFELDRQPHRVARRRVARDGRPEDRLCHRRFRSRPEELSQGEG